MMFTDRSDAGRQLACRLTEYHGADVVVYALPRGGVPVAVEIARALEAPLDLVVARKIGHPLQPEYAIAAVAENGDLVGNDTELAAVDPLWLRREVRRQRAEARRRREQYQRGRAPIAAKGKTAILVDDGIATGLTLRVAIAELRHRHPARIVVAVPVAPADVAARVRRDVDRFVALAVEARGEFRGAVGAYYEDFTPVSDDEVRAMLREYDDSRVAHATVPAPDPAAGPDATLLAFPRFEDLACLLATLPGMVRGAFRVEQHANGERYCTLECDVHENDCLALGSVAPPETNLFDFLLLAHTVKAEHARRVCALLPYTAYARQDRKEPRQSPGAAFVGALLGAAGVDSLLTIDLHSVEARAQFPMPVTSLSTAALFAAEMRRLGLQHASVVAPDDGARARCEAVAAAAGAQRPVVVLHKTRSGAGVVHEGFEGAVADTAVIVDDMLDTGATLLSASELLCRAGVRQIVIFVTHGLFTGEVWRGLWNRNVRLIYCTDSIPAARRTLAPKIRVLPIGPIVRAALAAGTVPAADHHAAAAERSAVTGAAEAPRS